MKICRARRQLVFTFDNRFRSTGWAVPQSVRYRIFRLQATSHTGRKSCRVKSLYMKRFWEWHFYLSGCTQTGTPALHVCREYWMFYRWPGFFAVVWKWLLPHPLPHSPLPISIYLSLPVSPLERSVLTGERGGLGGEEARNLMTARKPSPQ
jgi:hypothetical protein